MILAIDTSTQWIGIALYAEREVLYEKVWKTQRRHTVELAPAIQETMQACGIDFSCLKALAVALGPGSFTSLRIGLAMIKGIALTWHLPVVGIPTLDILAGAVQGADLPLICVLQAGREKLAIGAYANTDGKWTSNAPIRVATSNELATEINKPTLIFGEMSQEDHQHLGRKWKNVILSSPAFSVRRPAILAELACQRWQAGQTDNIVTLTPIYVHTIESILE